MTPHWTWDNGRTGVGSTRLAGWSDGYTTDTTYQDLVNTDMCPVWFSMISVLNGQPPLAVDGPMVWLDVACGTGLGTVAVAAANPNIEVWGVDYNPTHIERARRLARAAELPNCHFVEASFEDLATQRHLGPFEIDVAVVNGVYSWVSAANQRHIVDAIGARLRAGGLAYVMYETAPGWSSMNPLAEALRLWVDADGRAGHLAFHDAAAAVGAVLDSGARFAPLGRREERSRAGWADAHGHYAAHEYLGSNFAPLHAHDVFATLSTAKCSLVGSLAPLDHHHYFSTPPEVADLVEGATDPVLAALVRDLATERALRRDLFRRGKAHPTRFEQDDWLHRITIAGTGDTLREEPLELEAMKVNLAPQFHAPLIQALIETDLNVATVMAIHPEWAFTDAVTAMALLVAGGYAVPVRPGPPSPEATAACQRLNEVLAYERQVGRDHNCLASPAAGAMVALDLVETLALDAIWRGTTDDVSALADQVQASFSAQGLFVREKNELIKDPAAARVIIERRVTNLLSRQPALARLGIV